MFGDNPATFQYVRENFVKFQHVRAISLYFMQSSVECHRSSVDMGRRSCGVRGCSAVSCDVRAFPLGNH